MVVRPIYYSVHRKDTLKISKLGIFNEKITTFVR